MMTPCEQVAERVALGEALGDLAGHVASCDRCAGVVAMPGALGATHREVDPGLGFSARMTVGAQQRLTVRRRRRLAMGLAATVAAGALGVFFVTHQQGDPASPPSPVATTTNPPAPAPEADEATDEDLRALAGLADTDHNAHVSAHWRDLEAPLRPYQQLVEGVTP